jgi:hypothetical protein
VLNKFFSKIVINKYGSSFVLENIIEELRVFGIHMSPTIYDPNTFAAMKRLYMSNKGENVHLCYIILEDLDVAKLLNKIDLLFKEDFNMKKIIAKYRLNEI